jgi:raffinose/stachyose/melibiose transport system substrate-binding protein
MKQKILLTVLVFALIANGLYAGGRGQSGSSASGGASGKTSVITLLIDKDTNFAGAQAVIDAIETKLGIHTEIEIRQGGTEGDNIIKTRLATGDMSDIFLYNSGSVLQNINPARNILDLTDESFMVNVTDSFKTAVSVNGRVYAAPVASSVVGGWLYNKRVYRELGLQVPHTWKDLLANMDKAQAAGKTALIGAYKDTWTSQLIILADEYNVKAAIPTWPADYTANRRKIANTPAALRSFEKLAETGKYLNKDFLATSYDVGMEMLATGQGVHWPMLGALASIAINYPR